MLRNRVLTALLLAPLVIAAVIYLPPVGFALLWGLVILLAAWEWTGLSGLEPMPFRVAFVLGLVVIGYSSKYWGEFVLDWLHWPVVAWWILLAMLFRKAPEKLLSIRYPVWIKLLAGALVLTTSWLLMVWLRLNFGVFQVVYLVLLVWLADVTAYFVGKNYGFTKLVAAISPGKTVEGVYGAILMSAVFALAVGLVLQFKAIEIGDLVFLSVVTILVSICGDLFESLIKRLRGVKDSSGILPGHGGVLDRVDSLLAAVSVFYAGSIALGIFLQGTVTLDTGVSMEQPEHPSGIEAPVDPDHHDHPEAP